MTPVNTRNWTTLHQQFENTLKYCALSNAILLLRRKENGWETAERLGRLHYGEKTFTRDASISEQTFTVRSFQARHLALPVRE